MSANVITCFRLLFSAALLFCPVFSLPFYGLYLAAGLSDMIDGTVARRTGTASEFGAKLDTVADLAFVIACLIKLLPTIDIPAWMLVWTGVIALTKGINIVSGYVMRKRFVTVHTTMNRVAGALLFVFPLTFPFVGQRYTGIVVCAVASVAAIQEGHLILNSI